MKGLNETYVKYFPVGAAVSLAAIEDSSDLLTGHFGSVTAENNMKPMFIQPSEGVFQFDTGDRIADFARKNKLLLRGHTFVWHKQTPEWFFENKGEPAGREKVLERLEKHIQTTMDQYKDIAYAWDVVNEAIADKPEAAPLRESKWLETVGPDYIERAFSFAAATDKDKVLFYNDYNETDPVKSKRIYDLVSDLKKNGAKVDGIGMQGHYNIYGPSADDICAAIELYASLGVQIQFTELDVSMFPAGDSTQIDAPTPEMEEKFIEKYSELFSIFRKYSKYITGVTLWGASDDHTWLSKFPVKGRKNWPLLFDSKHKAKKAFFRVVEEA